MMGIIYCIKNTITGNRYIGQTKQQLRRRWLAHVQVSKDNPKSVIHKAIASYGKETFEVTQLDSGNTQEELDEKEQHWIDILNTLTPNGYNLKSGGLEGSVYSKESRKKMSKAKKGKYCGENHPAYGKPGWSRGKKLPKEMRRRMSEGCKKSKLHRKFGTGEDNPNYGKPMPEHVKQAISEGREKYYSENIPPWARKVRNIDTGKVFDTMKAAAEYYNISTSHIVCVCKGRRKTTGGYRWEYVNETTP